MQIRLKDNYINIDGNIFFMVLNHNGELNLAEDDNNTTIAKCDETINDIDLNSPVKDLTFLGKMEFIDNRERYITHFFWNKEKLLELLTTDINGKLIQHRVIGLNVEELDLDDYEYYEDCEDEKCEIVSNILITDGDKNNMSYIINSTETFDDLIYNAIVYDSKNIKPNFIKIGSKCYLINNEGITEIFISESFSLIYGGIHTDKINKLDFIQLLLNNKDDIQHKLNNKFGFYYTSQKLPNSLQSINIFLNYKNNTCVLTGVMNGLGTDIIEIPITQPNSINISKVQITPSYILFLDESNKICKAYKRLLGVPFREVTFNLADAVYEYVNNKENIIDLSNIQEGFNPIYNLTLKLENLRFNYVFGITKSQNMYHLAVKDDNCILNLDIIDAPFTKKMTKLYEYIARKFGDKLNASKVIANIDIIKTVEIKQEN